MLQPRCQLSILMLVKQLVICQMPLTLFSLKMGNSYRKVPLLLGRHQLTQLTLGIIKRLQQQSHTRMDLQMMLLLIIMLWRQLHLSLQSMIFKGPLLIMVHSGWTMSLVSEMPSLQVLVRNGPKQEALLRQHRLLALRRQEVIDINLHLHTLWVVSVRQQHPKF